MELITSLRNPKVISWRSLKDRKGRDELHAFMVEGPKMVEEALRSQFPVRTVLIREGYEPPFPVPAETQVCMLSENVFQSVCDTKTPQGIAAVTGISIQPLKGRFLLALDGIQDPGNMGTMIRTADAAGFEGMILSRDCADVFSPKVIRSTMGSIFRMTFSFPDSLASSLCSLRDSGFAVISSQLDGEPFYHRESVSAPLVLIIGNEGNGISDEVKSVASHHFRLPMNGGAESLNAAVAAGIMMYDLVHR